MDQPVIKLLNTTMDEPVINLLNQRIKDLERQNADLQANNTKLHNDLVKIKSIFVKIKAGDWILCARDRRQDPRLNNPVGAILFALDALSASYADQIAFLESELAATESDRDTFLRYIGSESVGAITIPQYKKALAALAAKKAKRK